MGVSPWLRRQQVLADVDDHTVGLSLGVGRCGIVYVG